MRTYYVNTELEDVREPFMVRVDVGDTVQDLKNKIGEQLGMNGNNLKVGLN